MSGLADELTSLVNKLQSERQKHLDAIAQIDQAFAQLGINVKTLKTEGTTRRGPGRPRGSTKAAKAPRRRGRGSYDQTSEEFVLSMFAPGKSLTTREINQQWKQAGRGGSADNTLSKLAKAGQIARKNIEGKRGSEYRLAG